MTRTINPFVVTGKIPTAYFCDRVEESKVLLNALTNQMNVVLTAERRMGKTSLVDFVFDKPEIKTEYVTIAVDILHTTTFKEFILAFGSAVFDRLATRSDKLMRLFASTLRSLSASFGYDPVQNSPTFDLKIGDIVNPAYSLGEIFQYLENADTHCLIIIDEFQQVTKYPEKNVEALLRTHIQKLQNANFVFSGSQRRIMEEMFFSNKRPFYQSAKSIRLEPIEKAVYCDFAISLFKQGAKNLTADAFEYVYDIFHGVTLYVQRIMKDAYAETPKGATCDKDLVKELVERYIAENDKRLREQMAFISEAQKELLYAIHAEGKVKSITSAAFIKKHRLKSASSSQSAALKLLEYDFITRKELIYSISDPLLDLWLSRMNLQP